MLLLTSICLAGGLLLGRYISRGTRASKAQRDAPLGETSGGDELGDPAWPSKAAKPAKPPPERDLFVGFPCRLGDVVMRSGGGEAWLAGACVFSEDAPVSALFIAPEAGADVAVYARAAASAPLWWMQALGSDELPRFTDPPTSLEHGETRFERRRRLPLAIERRGSGAPDLGDSAIVAEYASSGADQLLLIIHEGNLRAWRGTSLDAGMYEVIPSGASTLDSD
jgi:hypothetical protein